MKKLLNNPHAAPILDLLDVDAALAKIFDLKNSIDAVQAATEKQINAIKDEAAVQCLHWTGQIQSLEEAMLKFVESNRAQLFAKNKSVKLNAGVIGYRFSSRLVIKNAKATIEKIRQFFRQRAKDVIIVKESPDKNALAKWQPAELKKIGAQLETRDEFYYEPVNSGISTASA